MCKTFPSWEKLHNFSNFSTNGIFKWEREHHQEREKAESDALQREADRRHEIELARLRVDDNVLNRSGQAERNIGSMGSVPKLPSFDEKMDDLDAYLYRFEGYATMQGWPKERWASNLRGWLSLHDSAKMPSGFNKIHFILVPMANWLTG